ncbi:hypothetical protein FA13DRAFT_1905215 [Coprinellus micaceus]|uniref:F-box domain-containing protein n=1 Tax=Coprinellus micaceus TaxID=71717 RepID=A0A4Y7STA9_COPMI|nr:hypothetical protein FA13DRAFT_1905215 [Coprinellus micaceus]
MTTLFDLPIELAMYILTELRPLGLIRMSQVCKVSSSILADRSVWEGVLRCIYRDNLLFEPSFEPLDSLDLCRLKKAALRPHLFYDKLSKAPQRMYCTRERSLEFDVNGEIGLYYLPMTPSDLLYTLKKGHCKVVGSKNPSVRGGASTGQRTPPVFGSSDSGSQEIDCTQNQGCNVLNMDDMVILLEPNDLYAWKVPDLQPFGKPSPALVGHRPFRWQIFVHGIVQRQNWVTTLLYLRKPALPGGKLSGVRHSPLHPGRWPYCKMGDCGV